MNYESATCKRASHMIVIEDTIHAEQCGQFERFQDAIGELRRLANIAWDRPPNQAPCISWHTCGREYHVIEYDDSIVPWKLLRSISVLSISAEGIQWADGFEQQWEDRRRNE